MKTLHIIRGLPGSGKTTFAAKLGCMWFEADDWFTDYEGEYRFEPTEVHSAHQYCRLVTEYEMRNDISVELAVANTFTTIEEMEPYFKLAQKYGWQVKVWRMNGDFGSVHNVPDETINRMKHRFQDWPGEVVPALLTSE